MATELAVMASADQMELAAAFMPVMQMGQAVQRYNALLDFTKQIMREGKDYGTIPGVDKPSLFKPGAEKLCNFFGLTPKFVVVKETEQWEGDEPFFYYWYKCQLWRGSFLIAEGDGSCNSRETKYRYRWVAEDQIPQHLNKSKLPFRAGKATEPDFAIEKGETGGKYGKPAAYWQAFRDAIHDGRAVQGKKQSSTGKDMKTWSIESTVYRIPNPEISDVVNTIQKMSQKRALVAVTLIGCNASEYFTQDIEDMDSINVPFSVVPAVPTQAQYKPTPTQKSVADAKIEQMKAGVPYAQTTAEAEQVPDAVAQMWTDMKNIASVCNIFARLKARLVDVAGAAGEAEYYAILANFGGGAKHSNELKQKAARQCAWKMYTAIERAIIEHGDVPEFDDHEPIPMHETDDREHSL